METSTVETEREFVEFIRHDERGRGGNHYGTRNVCRLYAHPTVYTISHEEDEDGGEVKQRG
jgi:hypothetical protein